MEGNPKDGGAQAPGTPTTKLTIKVSDDRATGAYSNMAFIHSNEMEFVFDFIYAEPQRPAGQVVSRVISSPKTAKRLLAVLTEGMKRYEERYGTIPVPETGSVQGTYH